MTDGDDPGLNLAGSILLPDPGLLFCELHNFSGVIHGDNSDLDQQIIQIRDVSKCPCPLSGHTRRTHLNLIKLGMCF